MKNLKKLINRLDRFHPDYDPVGMEFDWFDTEARENEESVSVDDGEFDTESHENEESVSVDDGVI